MLVHLPDLGDVLPLNSAALAPFLHLYPHYVTARVEFESLLGHRCSTVKNNQPSLRSLQRPIRKGKKSLQEKGNEKEGGTPKSICILPLLLALLQSPPPPQQIN